MSRPQDFELKPAIFAQLVVQNAMCPGFGTVVSNLVLQHAVAPSRANRKKASDPAVFNEYVKRTDEKLLVATGPGNVGDKFSDLIVPSEKNANGLIIGVKPAVPKQAKNKQHADDATKTVSDAILFPGNGRQFERNDTVLFIGNGSTKVKKLTTKMSLVDKPTSKKEKGTKKEKEVQGDKQNGKKDKGKTKSNEDSEDEVSEEEVREEEDLEGSGESHAHPRLADAELMQGPSLLDIYLAARKPVAGRDKAPSLFDRDLYARTAQVEQQFLHRVLDDDSIPSLSKATLNDCDKLSHHIILCGNLNSCSILGDVIFHLRRDYWSLRPIVLLSPDPPPEQLRRQFFCFPKVFYLSGNAQDKDDLQRAGVERADIVLILSQWTQWPLSTMQKGREKAVPVMEVHKLVQELKGPKTRCNIVMGRRYLQTQNKYNKKYDKELVNDPLYVGSNVVSYDFVNEYYKKIRANNLEHALMFEKLITSVATSISLSSDSQLKNATTYGEAFEQLVKGRAKLPIALYRSYSAKEKDPSAKTAPLFTAFAIAHPSLTLPLHKHDSVIVLWDSACTPREELFGKLAFPMGNGARQRGLTTPLRPVAGSVIDRGNEASNRVKRASTEITMSKSLPAFDKRSASSVASSGISKEKKTPRAKTPKTPKTPKSPKSPKEGKEKQQEKEEKVIDKASPRSDAATKTESKGSSGSKSPGDAVASPRKTSTSSSPRGLGSSSTETELLKSEPAENGKSPRSARESTGKADPVYVVIKSPRGGGTPRAATASPAKASSSKPTSPRNETDESPKEKKGVNGKKSKAKAKEQSTAESPRTEDDGSASKKDRKKKQEKKGHEDEEHPKAKEEETGDLTYGEVEIYNGAGSEKTSGNIKPKKKKKENLYG